MTPDGADCKSLVTFIRTMSVGGGDEDLGNICPLRRQRKG